MSLNLKFSNSKVPFVNYTLSLLLLLLAVYLKALGNMPVIFFFFFFENSALNSKSKCMKKMVSQIFKRKLQSGCNFSSNLHHTYISWSQGFNSTIQLGFVLTYRLLICLNLPLEVHYFHLQRTHMAITMGTKYRGKILLRQNHSL